MLPLLSDCCWHIAIVPVDVRPQSVDRAPSKHFARRHRPLRDAPLLLLAIDEANFSPDAESEGCCRRRSINI
jgi:hypothetical protein